MAIRVPSRTKQKRYGYVRYEEPPIVLVCPVLVSPANGSTIETQTTATLEWSAAQYADTYNVYIWPANTSRPDVPTANTASLSYEATGLTQNTEYSWTVTPVYLGEEKEDCAEFGFTTDAVVVFECPVISQVEVTDTTAQYYWPFLILPNEAEVIRFYFYLASGPEPTLDVDFIQGTLDVDGFYALAEDLTALTGYKVLATFYGAGQESMGCEGVSFTTDAAPGPCDNEFSTYLNASVYPGPAVNPGNAVLAADGNATYQIPVSNVQPSGTWPTSCVYPVIVTGRDGENVLRTDSVIDVEFVPEPLFTAAKTFGVLMRLSLVKLTSGSPNVTITINMGAASETFVVSSVSTIDSFYFFFKVSVDTDGTILNAESNKMTVV